jgi:twitching motility protein PilT
MTLDELLAAAAARGASDIHLRANEPPFVRIAGLLEPWTSMPAPTAEHLESTAARILSLEQSARFRTAMHLDVAWRAQGAGRVRANVFRQRGTVGISLRLIPDVVPPVDQLGLAPSVLNLAKETRGLVLVTGVTGSGKSTTLASLIDLINRTRPVHILTLEDPIEFVHNNQLAVVTQREVGIDAPNYASGVRAALRQDPDVILIGEMRGPATIKAALTAASTGHLVFSTLHTTDAAETVSRIVTSFPTHTQATVRQQLATVLRATISQRLLPRADGTGLALASEVLIATPYIRDCIASRDKISGISDAIVAGASQYGMQSFDQSILALVNAGTVEADEALRWVTNVEEFKMQMRGITRGGSMSPAPVEAPVPVQTYSIADAFSTSRPGSR